MTADERIAIVLGTAILRALRLETELEHINAQLAKLQESLTEPKITES